LDFRFAILDWGREGRNKESGGEQINLSSNLKSKIGSVKYFSASENRDLGIVKRSRKQKRKLVVSPFPTTQQSPEQFCFQPPGSNFNLSDVTEINLSNCTH
jgi:hypothetical protein